MRTVKWSMQSTLEHLKGSEIPAVPDLKLTVTCSVAENGEDVEGAGVFLPSSVENIET